MIQEIKGAAAFGHYGKTLFEVFKFLGVEDVSYNQLISCLSDIFWWTSEIENLVPTEDFGPYESDAGVVYEAKIRKEDIYAYLVADNTIFLNPDKLFNILHHKNYPLDDIELRDEDTVRR